MIRDDTKIFGEPNDPNTVTAAGALTNDMYIVGAGNKGVKSLAITGGNLIVTKAGVATGFKYDTPNKVIGTDASGNLILKDQIRPTTFFQFGGDINPATAVVKDGSAAITLTGLTNESEGVSYALASKGGTDYSGADFIFTFQNSLILLADTQCRLLASGSFAEYHLSGIALRTTGGTDVELRTTPIGALSNDAAAVVNKTITIPAGTYNRVVLKTGGLAQSFSNIAVVVSCLITY